MEETFVSTNLHEHAGDGWRKAWWATERIRFGDDAAVAATSKVSVPRHLKPCSHQVQGIREYGLYYTGSTTGHEVEGKRRVGRRG